LIRRGSVVGWVYLIALICLFSVTFWGTVVTERNSAKQERVRAANATNFSPASSQPDRFDTTTSSRTLFPYSVIPGGVESAEELRNALEHDPIAAAHYADFDVSQTHVVRLASDEEMYVSYRLNNRIYWTNKKLRLLKGETVITDGQNTARTRCGNRLSATAQAPIATRQPLDMTLDPAPLPDMAEARPMSLPMTLPFPAFSSQLASSPGSGGGADTPLFFPIAGGGSPSHNTTTPPTTPPTIPPDTPPTTPPVATPEPGSFVLTAAGISIVLTSGWFGYLRRRIQT
jgi:hypothetical protein